MMENSEPRSNVMKIGAIINGGPHENGVNTQGTDSVFYTFSFNSCVRLQENGRIYAVYHNKINLFPCDEQEQDRLDIFHELFARVQRVYGLQFQSRPTGIVRFLDLGCGTGIWAIDSAKNYPNAYVLGVDIAAIQPPNHPPNCEFRAPYDFEKSWKQETWDLIHLQLGCGGVYDWSRVYREAFAHLNSGGCFEQLEIDFEPRCDNGSLNGSALTYWYRSLKKATEELKCPLTHSFHETVMGLNKAGFREVWHHSILLPLSPWPLDVRGKYIGHWYNLAMIQSIETLSLAPFSRAFGWPLRKIQCLAADVRSEILQTRIHSYNILHVYSARKSI